MADPIVVATRRADALHRFDAEAAKLSKLLGIEIPEPIPHEINRDQELRRVYELERVVRLIANVTTALERRQFAQVVQEEVQAMREEERGSDVSESSSDPPAGKPVTQPTQPTKPAGKSAKK